MIITRSRLISLALAGSTLIAVPTAYSLTKLGRGTVNVTARLNFDYDTNIFGNSSESGDSSVVFTPGLSYTRNVGVISTAVNLGVKSIAFNDTNGQDSLDPFLNANFRLDRAQKGSISSGFTYARTTEANELLLTRTQSDEFRGNGRIDYFYSDKTGVRANVQYRLSDFNTSGFGDVDSYSVGGGLLYRYSPKLTTNLTYDYSPESVKNSANTGSNPNSENHRISVGLDGQLRPKVNGNISVGKAYRNFDVGGSADTFLLASSISWTASAKTSFNLSSSKNFDTSAGAESIRLFAVTLGVKQTLTEKLSISGNVGRQETDIDQVPGPIARADKADIWGLKLDYLINEHFNASGGVTHRNNTSSLLQADYVRTVYTFALNASF
jgi:hypothetical protein